MDSSMFSVQYKHGVPVPLLLKKKGNDFFFIQPKVGFQFHLIAVVTAKTVKKLGKLLNLLLL